MMLNRARNNTHALTLSLFHSENKTNGKTKKTKQPTKKPPLINSLSFCPLETFPTEVDQFWCISILHFYLVDLHFLINPTVQKFLVQLLHLPVCAELFLSDLNELCQFEVIHCHELPGRATPWNHWIQLSSFLYNAHEQFPSVSCSWTLQTSGHRSASRSCLNPSFQEAWLCISCLWQISSPLSCPNAI